MTMTKIYLKVREDFYRYLHNDRAVSAIEYAVVVGVVVTGLGVAMVAFNAEVIETLTELTTTVQTQTDPIIP